MDDWRSYDEVADRYERIHAPRFAKPAADLTAMSEIGTGDRVLDVGTGTGIAAAAAAAAGAAPVYGIDPSEGMLSVARRERPNILLARAVAVDLPFPDGSFDAVIANFVIPNQRNHETALADIIRVLRPGGTFAMSAWGDNRDDLERAWEEQVAYVLPGRMLEQMREKETPYFSRFADRNFTEEVLGRAGFKKVRTQKHDYRFRYQLDEYLEGIEVWRAARFVREMVGEKGWEEFRRRTREAFMERFADPLNDFVSAILTTAIKP